MSTESCRDLLHLIVLFLSLSPLKIRLLLLLCTIKTFIDFERSEHGFFGL